MNNDKFLPLGTVVLLKNAKHRVMVIGYMTQILNTKKIYDYSGCMFPEGYVASSQVLAFNHEDIDKIYYIGHNDDTVKKNNDYLKKFEKKYLNNDKELTKQIHEIAIEIKEEGITND